MSETILLPKREMSDIPKIHIPKKEIETSKRTLQQGD